MTELDMFESITRAVHGVTDDIDSLDNLCEQEIFEEKQVNGRVSTITMKYLRNKYGKKIANHAMYRLQKKLRPVSNRTSSLLGSITGVFLKSKLG